MTKALRFGLSKEAYNKLSGLLIQFSEFEKVLIFGSRALGTYHEGSDIDMVVYGTRISRELLRTFKIYYDDLNLPYQLDLINYNLINNDDLKKHIDKNGVSFFNVT
jgi:predicted nucleotidyltransferase